MSRTPLYLLIVFALLAALSSRAVATENPNAPAGAMPAYDEQGNLLLPESYRTWVFVGSSLGLSYSEGGPASGGHEMFHHTLMEPSAHAHFARTGEFRDGTMLALLLHGLGEGVLPGRRGRFANEIHAVELAVKDRDRFEGDWAYFNFGGMNGVRDRAEAFPAASCQACHAEHAAYDNVFVQFYPLLADAAPEGAAVHARLAAMGEREHDSASPEEAAEPVVATTPLALGGLDPVHLVAGREELGKPEIVVEHAGFRYQFVSEPSRARFAQEPERFGIQNETCPVVPGAPIDGRLWAVHEGKVFAFASQGCVEQFRADPAAFLDESS